MTAAELRMQLLQQSGLVIDNVVKLATGQGPYIDQRIDKQYQNEVWKALVPMLQKIDDPSPLAKLSSGTIEERVDAILHQVAIGKMTAQTAKGLLELLQAGFGDLTSEQVEGVKQFVVNVTAPVAVKNGQVN